MDKKDWYEAGDQIKKLVQDAVDSGDFTQLGNTISNVVNGTVDGLQSVLKENLGNAQKAGAGNGHRYTRNSYDYTNREAAERIRRNMQERAQHRQGHIKQKDQMYRPVKVRMKVPGEISGRVMKWTGYSLGSMFGFAAGILGIIGITTGIYVGVPFGIMAFLFGSSMCLGASGSRKLGLAKRFRRYKEVIGTRTYCLVEELANAIGQDHKFVQKDLKRMISKGLFSVGYLDRKETLLITDQETYQQYLTTQTEYEKRELEEDIRKRRSEAETAKRADAPKQAEAPKPKAEEKRNLSPECRELIEEGKRYIFHIHDCNERIPDETMSAKLDRLELVITRIFREAEKDPEIVSELKKLMSYYLPTTKKLLDAYCEMDMQPIRGQNIENTKKEIENALDTVNTAFENLLDSLFEETAWDISSDISVLNTMLAQEGLTGKDFAGKS